MIFPLAARMENRPSRPVTVPVGLPFEGDVDSDQGISFVIFHYPPTVLLLSTSTFDCGIIMIYLSLIL